MMLGNPSLWQRGALTGPRVVKNNQHSSRLVGNWLHLEVRGLITCQGPHGVGPRGHCMLLKFAFLKTLQALASLEGVGLKPRVRAEPTLALPLWNLLWDEEICLKSPWHKPAPHSPDWCSIKTSR